MYMCVPLSWFSPLTLYTPGLKLRTPGLGASTLLTEFALAELFAL